MEQLREPNCIELVGHGHPDRFADYIGEKVLTENLIQDPKAKVALEVLATRNSISLGGEITSTASIDYEELVYDAIEEVYGEEWWPNFREIKVFNHIEEQSPELSEIQNSETLAGDQGVIFGYYNKERFTRIKGLYNLMERVVTVFDLAPDWKLLWSEKELSMSVCGRNVDHGAVEEYVLDQLRDNFSKHKDSETFLVGTEEFEVIVNPKGDWEIPGPLADTGVVGRKLMIDTFGAGIPHGGGAFCGKDPSKVDKTGILWGSEIAKNFAIDNNIEGPVLVELNFKIGDKTPIAVITTKEGVFEQEVKETLQEFINRKNLLTENWVQHSKKGNVLSFLREI